MSIPNQTGPTEASFSMFGGGRAADPFALFAQMRSTAAVVPMAFPIGGTDRKAWMVTRMEETVRILKDHARFTVDPRVVGVNFFAPASADTSAAPSFFTPGASMVSVDEPDHRRLRGLVSKAFTPMYMEGLRPRVQQMADALLDRVQEQGQMDIVDDYAFPLPVNVISEMLGVPESDWVQIRRWSEALAHSLEAQGGDNARHMREFGAYAAQLAAEKRRRPADDLISQLIAIEEGGDRLSEPELLSMITLLIFAGHETTSNLLSIGTLMLLDHPDQLEKLKADPSLVPAAVEEMLRFNGPITIAAPRFATEDVEIAGHGIGKGDMLILALISANRDEAYTPHPDEMDITRAANRHVAFGQGIHICLGAPLARLEGDIAFTTLLKRMPDLRLGVPRESITWRVSSNLRGLNALPVAF